MIVMLDTSQKFDSCESELGCAVEQLFTPLTRYNAQRPAAVPPISTSRSAKIRTSRASISVSTRVWIVTAALQHGRNAPCDPVCGDGLL